MEERCPHARNNMGHLLRVPCRNRIAPREGRTRPEQVRCHAYRCVGVAARNRQNQLRPSSLLRPVVTERVRGSTPSRGFWFTRQQGSKKPGSRGKVSVIRK